MDSIESSVPQESSDSEMQSELSELRSTPGYEDGSLKRSVRSVDREKHAQISGRVTEIYEARYPEEVKDRTGVG